MIFLSVSKHLKSLNHITEKTFRDQNEMHTNFVSLVYTYLTQSPPSCNCPVYPALFLWRQSIKRLHHTAHQRQIPLMRLKTADCSLSTEREGPQGQRGGYTEKRNKDALSSTETHHHKKHRLRSRQTV